MVITRASDTALGEGYRDLCKNAKTSDPYMNI
jgi:hypothetical protein